MSRPMPFVILGILNVIGVAILGLGLYSLSSSLYYSRQIPRWPTTPGQITHLDLETHTDNDEATRYTIKVEYQYAVEGVVHQGSRLTLGSESSSAYHHQRQLFDRLKGCRSVLVRYDPSDPQVSCLTYRFEFGSIVVVVFGLVWLAISLGITAGFWLNNRPESPLLRHLIVE